MSSVLDSRVMSGFPLSIGTALAFESLFESRQDPYDPERVIPEIKDVDKYTNILINVDTLVRNIISSVPAEDIKEIRSEDLSAVAIDEMDIIQDILALEGKKLMKPTFYYMNYESIKKEFGSRFVVFRQNNTEKQIRLANLHSEAKELILKQAPLVKSLRRSFDEKFGQSMIITHHAVDLLNRKEFTKLDLLESNTGELKERFKWYTKFYNGKALVNIPFNKKTLAVFGDKEFIQPMPMKIRNQIIELANDRNWNFGTTTFKVVSDVDMFLPDRLFVSEFKKI